MEAGHRGRNASTRPVEDISRPRTGEREGETLLLTQCVGDPTHAQAPDTDRCRDGHPGQAQCNERGK
ncbi:MAG: hypothetical protein NVS2B16_07120 [Chloroflexota bacterium]